MIKCEKNGKKYKIVIFGTGSFGEVAYYYLTKDSECKVVAFTVDKSHLKQNTLFDLPVIEFEKIQKEFPPDEYKMFIAIGYSGLNSIRAQKYYEAKKKGYELISYICSRAIIWDNVEIEDNTFIFEANVIQPYVKIGKNVIIWSGNHIGHHSKIGNHVFIASHAVISGHVEIGDYSFIGVNSTIIDGIKITEKTIIGAGALVVKDIIKSGVYIGQPARFLRDINENEFR